MSRMHAVKSGGPGDRNTGDRELRRELGSVRPHRVHIETPPEEAAGPGARAVHGPAGKRLPMCLAVRGRHDELGELTAEHVAFE
jgi:hypothetical protein